jgi:hypothetical protein
VSWQPTVNPTTAPERASANWSLELAVGLHGDAPGAPLRTVRATTSRALVMVLRRRGRLLLAASRLRTRESTAQP